MRDGWIPAYRKLFDRNDWMAPTKKHPAGKIEAWLDLCQQAQHATYEHAGERLQRGEVMVSLTACEHRWKWSRKRVRSFLNGLVMGSMMGIVRGTPNGTVYSIVNYDTYAIGGHTQGHSQGHSKGTARAPEQERSINKTASSVHTDAPTDEWPAKPKQTNGAYAYPARFEQAWASYPTRSGSNPKMGAYMAFRARVHGGADVGDLLKSSEHYRTFCAASGKEGTEYVAQAATFWGPREAWREFIEPKQVNGTPTNALTFAQQERQRWLDLNNGGGQ